MEDSAVANPYVSFGPQGEEWVYNRSTKTYDLTRGRPGAVRIRTTEGPEDTFISIAPSLSALVIVDMQNFFLHPECRDHPAGLAAVEPTLKVIEKCRQAGIQVGMALSVITLPLGPPRGVPGCSSFTAAVRAFY